MTLRSRTVDAVFGALELVVALHDWIRNLRKPGPQHDGHTEPFPLERPKVRDLLERQGKVVSLRESQIRPVAAKPAPASARSARRPSGRTDN